MKVFISLSDSANHIPTNHNEEWHSIVDVVQPSRKKVRGMKKAKRRIPKNEGTEMDLQPSFGMEARFK